MLDHENKTISIGRLLATKPLRSELLTRPGPGNRKLTYLSGDSVTRTLNDIFGFDGWCLEIKESRRESCEKDDKQRFHVAYTSVVRLTHRQTGAFKEDCGAGDSIDRSIGKAVSHALKASVTDAMKRAARHFGDKLGNSLYDTSFTLNKAPGSLKDALNTHAIERAKSKFGFDKDRVQKAVVKNVGTGNTTCLGGAAAKNLKSQGDRLSNVANLHTKSNANTNAITSPKNIYSTSGNRGGGGVSQSGYSAQHPSATGSYKNSVFTPQVASAAAPSSSINHRKGPNAVAKSPYGRGTQTTQIFDISPGISRFQKTPLAASKGGPEQNTRTSNDIQRQYQPRASTGQIVKPLSEIKDVNRNMISQNLNGKRMLEGTRNPTNIKKIVNPYITGDGSQNPYSNSKK